MVEVEALGGVWYLKGFSDVLVTCIVDEQIYGLE